MRLGHLRNLVVIGRAPRSIDISVGPARLVLAPVRHRSTMIGSTRVARRTGASNANPAQMSSVVTASPIAIGSSPGTPESWVRSREDADRADTEADGHPGPALPQNERRNRTTARAERDTNAELPLARCRHAGEHRVDTHRREPGSG
jgi:hypothetical protein